MTDHHHELTINELDAVSGGKDFNVFWSGGGDAMQLQKPMERRSKLLDTLAAVMNSMSQTSKTISDNMR